MRAVLKGKTQEFIQGGITPSGLATQVRRGIIKGFDPTTYRATVQLLGSLSVWLEGVPVAKHIGANLLSSGARCGVLFFDESNPGDACVAFVYDGAPGPWITSGLVVDGAITAADCLSNVAGGVATIDASGDLNPPNHVRAAGRFYPGGQGTRYLYDAGATSGLAVGGGPFSATGYIYPGTGSALQTAGYLTADAAGNLALMGGKVGIGVSPSVLLHMQGASPELRIENNADSTDPTIWLKRKNYAPLGVKIWHDDNVGHAYFDNLYENDAASIYFRTKASGASPINALTILGSGKVGIGTTNPASLFHVLAGNITEGALDPSVKMVLENNDSVGLQFLTPNNKNAIILFGDPELSTVGQIDYLHSTNMMRFTTNNSVKMAIDVNGHVQTLGYIYPGTGSALQTSRYIRDDGDRLLAYGGFKIDVSSGDTPLVFQRAGAYKWVNYVYATYDDLRWGAYISGAWYDRMVLDDGSGNLYIDGTYNTFSPLPPKENMTPEDYLAWALEDASKPPKPYPGIPKDPVELERYRKDVSKIAIGVARYVDHLRTQVAALEARLARAGL